MKIPFDIKFRPQIESGEYKVETATGKQARIICWDKKSDMNKKKIVALLDDGNSEHTEYYTENGTVYEKAPAGGDLFLITPEPELSELEKGLVDFYRKRNELVPDKDGVFNRHDLDELLHKTSSELLALAIKELQPKIDAEIEKTYKNADGVMYRRGKEDALKEIIKEIFPLETDIETLKDLNTAIQENGIGCYKHGFEEGKKVALKDLPRWRKNESPIVATAVKNYSLDGEPFDLWIVHGKRKISIKSLEKLPGFKEECHE